MDKDKEEFARISIDKKIDTGWDKPVPALNYWSFVLSRKVMSTQQSEFYKYMSAMLDQDIAVDLHGQFGYVSMLKDELLRQFNSRLNPDKSGIIAKAKKLIKLYNYKGNDLDRILSMEIVQKRKGRLKAYKNQAFAQWISPGQEIEVAGRKLTRGAFYLGSHLPVAIYKPEDGTFLRLVEDIEGPVINPDYIGAEQNEYNIAQPCTFAEQSPQLRDEIIAWLAGEVPLSKEILAYYLAGIEFFLLYDKRPTTEERKQVLTHLAMLLAAPDIPPRITYEFKDRINYLIDLAMARYFVDDKDFKISDPSRFPIYTRAKYCRLIDGNIAKTDSKERKVEIMCQFVPLPDGLPQEFADDYRKAFKSSLLAELSARYHPYSSDSIYTYAPINMQGVYFPDDHIRNSLKKSELKISERTKELYLMFKNTWARMLGSSKRFLEAIKNGGNPLALHFHLPSWIDPKKVPGVADAIAQISPAEGESYRLMPIQELLEAFGIQYIHAEYVDKNVFGNLQLRMYQVGLRIGASNTIIRVRYNDSVPVLRQDAPEIPRRGTLPISLYLIAWLLGTGDVSKRDMEIVDQWLEQYDPKANWAPSAQAVLSWLSSRKLTLNAKRKLKAAKLANFAKRRDELQRLLLQLVSAPEGTSPKRMKRLETIYETIGLDPTAIHSDIHRLATGAAKAPKGAKAASKSAASVLDRNLLRQMEESTASAKQMLAEVFQESETSEAKAEKPAKKAKKADPLTEITKALAKCDTWTRSDFEALAKKHGLTAGAALEMVNDKAYDLIDEAIADDDGDTITVDLDLAQSLLDVL